MVLVEKVEVAGDVVLVEEAEVVGEVVLVEVEVAGDVVL